MKKRNLAILTASVMCIMQLAGCGSAASPAAPEPAGETGKKAETATETEKEPEAKSESANTFANDFIEITIPDDIADVVDVEVSKDTISVYHKESKEAGFGGLDFLIWVASATDEYAGGPYIKIGELTDANGNDYDVIKGNATEIQWDYNLPDIPADFKKIDDAQEGIINGLKAVNGCSYAAGAGMKGADLYGDVLAKYVKAVEEGWDADRLEKEDMSAEFYPVIMYAEGNPLDSIGYAYQDVNVDGIDELFIGEISDGEFKGVAYDIYTMVDRKPAHVVTGTARDRYYDYENVFICNEWSGGAGMSGFDVYALMSNSTEMVYQYGYKYDEYEDEKKPWFRSYDGETYESVDEAEFDERTNTDNSIVRFDYTPLSQSAGTNGETKSDAEAKSSAALPAYDYPGPELFYTVLYQYLIDELSVGYEKADVGIPCPIIIEMDESEKDDIKVWGNFWYFNYKLNGDMLECTSGGSYPGLIHVKSTDAGYEVTGFDRVGDGSDYDPTAKKIFGKYYDEFVKSDEDKAGFEKTRAQIIANYVAANDLKITSYKDYGWDPVTLPKENIDNFYSILN